jgi:hypothetical protein
VTAVICRRCTRPCFFEELVATFHHNYTAKTLACSQIFNEMIRFHEFEGNPYITDFEKLIEN